MDGPVLFVPQHFVGPELESPLSRHIFPIAAATVTTNRLALEEGKMKMCDRSVDVRGIVVRGIVARKRDGPETDDDVHGRLEFLEFFLWWTISPTNPRRNGDTNAFMLPLESQYFHRR